MNSLLEHGIQTELNGGDVPAVPISALKVLKKLSLKDLIKKKINVPVTKIVVYIEKLEI